MTSDLQVRSWELRPILSTQGGKNAFPEIYEEVRKYKISPQVAEAIM
jgi:hypothetical protein